MRTGYGTLCAMTRTTRSGGPPVPCMPSVGSTYRYRPGETVALLGPNGAGKSTTIDMLLGLLPPDTGTVELFGTTPAQAIAAGPMGAHAAGRRGAAVPVRPRADRA